LKILVTGGCGFIGSYLVNLLSHSSDYEVYVVDNLAQGKLSNLDHCDRIIFYEKSITDYDFMQLIFRKHQFFAVIHLAAVSSVIECEKNPLETSIINKKASFNLIDLAIEHKVKKFIFSSSAAVYGNHPELPKKEYSPVLPISNYGKDKLAVEEYLREKSPYTNMKGIVLRFFNVYGPKQDPDSPYSGVLSIFIKKIISDPYPALTIFGNGYQTRDFIYVEEVAKGIQWILGNNQFTEKIFNMGTGVETNLLEIVSILEKISTKKIVIHFENKRDGDIFRSYSSVQNLKDIGFESNLPINDGLKKLYDFQFHEKNNISNKSIIKNNQKNPPLQEDQIISGIKN
jgi:UDP-glucose 4-epimerase